MTINRNKWLHQEIRDWESEGLVTAEQSELLVARYPLERGWSQYLFPVLGSILVGVGIILFFAANWQEMPVWSKLALILGALVISQHLGYRFRFASNQPWLGSGLLVLAGLIFGSAIFLIAQIYNINAYFPNGILFWGMGVLLMAAVTSEKPLLILGNLLLLVWVITDWSNSGQIIPWVAIILVFAATFPLAYRTRSAMAIFLSISLLTIVVAGSFSPDLICLTGLAGLALIGSAFFLRGQDNKEEYAGLYSLCGILLVMAVLYVLSFRGFYDIDQPGLAPYGLLVAALLIGCMLLARTLQNKEVRPQILAVGLLNAILFILVALSSSFLDVGLVMALVINIILFVVIIATIWQGSQGQNRVQVNLGLVFFYLLVLSRYFDFAFLYMERSLFFIIGGVLLIGLGIMLNRQQHKIVESWGGKYE